MTPAPYDVASDIRQTLLLGPEAEEEAGKRVRVQYRDPSDPSTYIRVKNDADVEEMMEEWVGLREQCSACHAIGNISEPGVLSFECTGVPIHTSHILPESGVYRCTHSHSPHPPP
jgi:hypothetical protein